jgi:hypothetical protein
MSTTTFTRRFKRDWRRCCRCAAKKSNSNRERCRVVHTGLLTRIATVNASLCVQMKKV